MAAAAMDSGAVIGLLNGSGQEMKLIVEPIALLVICAIVASIAFVVLGRNPIKRAEGKLRCQDGGAIVINVDGNGLCGQWHGTYALSTDTRNLEQKHFSRNRH